MSEFKLGDTVTINVGNYRGQQGKIIEISNGSLRPWLTIDVNGVQLLLDVIEVSKP